MTTLIKIPFASSGDKADVPATDAAGGVNWTQGYGPDYSKDPETDASAKRIEREEFNGLLNSITSAINEIQTNGVAPFISSADNGGSAFAYGLGAIVITGGKVYQSLKTANTDAVTVTASWSEICTVKKLNDELIKYALVGGNVNQAFDVKDASSNGQAVNLGQMNTALARKAELAGNAAQIFRVKDEPTDTNSATPVGRLNYIASIKANLNGDSNQTFYCSDSGYPTAAANNQRLDYMLQGKATITGNKYIQFQVADATDGTHAVRLYQFQSGVNGNGAWTRLPGGAQYARANFNIPGKTAYKWTYPAVFPATPAILFSAINGAPNVWCAGVGPSDCLVYNDNGSTLNVNAVAIW